MLAKKFCLFFNNCTTKHLFTENFVSQLTACDESMKCTISQNFSMDFVFAIRNPKRCSVYVIVFSHVLIALSIKRGRADRLRDFLRHSDCSEWLNNFLYFPSRSICQRRARKKVPLWILI
ncbi:hypothetical protein QR680_000663 [Steinernema hermaphroditum]|uniref:Uncharacterized protein n=1 Tax=Steinernema hermaphroditum TaxID=289476 RepID=A0AA39GVD8_9BILA|nr:hypothetical protein QR680_000663 [Steinernema hermaphroditum]